MTQSHLAKLLSEKKRRGLKFFIPYICAGHPTLEASFQIAQMFERAGADALELGVPFSDPVADGPINQRAAETALLQGVRLKDVLALVHRLRQAGSKIPIILFTYYNPIFKMSSEIFARLASQSGVDAVLIVDLPLEEAQGDLRQLNARGVDLIFLASPLTQASRLNKIDQASSAFIYYVSRTGVTGMQNEISPSLEDELKHTYSVLKKPLAVGFGISSPKQARRIVGHADGIVVGSALVDIIEKNQELNSSLDYLYHFTIEIKNAINYGETSC